MSDLSPEQQNTFSQFNSTLQLFLETFPEASINASICHEDRLSRFVQCQDLNQALQMSFSNLFSILTDLDESTNAGLVSVLFAILAKIKPEDKGVNQDLLYDVVGFLANNTHARGIAALDINEDTV